jgi:hypothetical protein
MTRGAAAIMKRILVRRWVLCFYYIGRPDSLSTTPVPILTIAPAQQNLFDGVIARRRSSNSMDEREGERAEAKGVKEGSGGGGGGVPQLRGRFLALATAGLRTGRVPAGPVPATAMQHENCTGVAQIMGQL